MDALLQEKIVPLVFGDGSELGIGGRELHSFTGEGIERLEDPLLAIFGQQVAAFAVVPVIQKDGRRHCGVSQPGDGELADAEVPVGMAGPLDIEIVAIVEGQLDAFALELVDDRAVVDALDGDVAAPSR